MEVGEEMEEEDEVEEEEVPLAIKLNHPARPQRVQAG